MPGAPAAYHSRTHLPFAFAHTSHTPAVSLPSSQTKADADLEKQMAVLNAKTKLAEDYDRKEKALAVEQRM